MAAQLKRGAPAAQNKSTKKARVSVAAPPSPSPSTASSDEGDEEDAEGSEADSEVDEFEVDDEDLVGDDGEDLLAGLDSQDEESVPSGVDDHDDEADSSTEDTPVAPPPFKKANVRNSRAAPALKPAELRALAFAELTASPISSILSTSVATLLAPLTPPAPASSPLQPLLKDLHAHLTGLSSVKPKSLKALKKKGVVVPPVEGVDGKWGEMELTWEKPRPEDVRVVGRWAWGGGTRTKGEYIIDLAVGMPATLLQPKDFMAPRFIIKSTHYLVTLSSRLPESLGPTTLAYAPLAGSQGYALEVRPNPPGPGEEKKGLAKIKGAVLRLRVVWPADVFAHSKLTPLSNLARPTTSESSTEVVLPPTPLRATAMHFSSLSLLTSHLKFHHTLLTTHSTTYSSAIRLLQAWATRRAYTLDMGFSSEWWAWCVARTLVWGTVGAGEASGATDGGAAWAAWRKAVEWLAGVNWTDGVWFRVEGDKAYPKDDFRKAFSGRPLFVDPTGTVNLAAGIELATLEMLKQDAKSTIALLLANVDDELKFESTFLRPIRASERFDNYARIVVPPAILTADAGLDFASPLESLVSSLSSTLTRALGTRIIAFQLTAPPPASVALKGPTAELSPVVLSLGLILDPVQSGRFVDQGPSAEDEAACADFCAFWGPKSELRRFKDGSILESVVWEDESQGSSLGPQRNKVVSHILKHIIAFRHGIPAPNVDVFAGAMDHLVVEPEGVRRAIFLEDSVSTGKGFGTLLAAFDALAKELKDLPDLPLAISSVQPTGAALRYSTIFTPSPRRLKHFDRLPESCKFIDMHDIQLTLEGSGRWPEDLTGVQKIKAAFLARIAEGLAGLHTVVEARVAFDPEAREVDDNVSLEILTATGFAFRARIFYERSLILIAEREAQLGSAVTPPSSIDLFNERFVHAPRHHAAIATLQHHFTSYSPTVRFVKRWFSTHMLLPAFPQELLELVAASVFIDPASPYDPPNSGATGFARVMDRLATWRWRDGPLMVPLYSFSVATTSGRRAAFSTPATETAIRSFEEQRLRDPVINEYAWLIATEEDASGRVWGRRTDRLAAGRVKALAKATLTTLDSGLVSGSLRVEQLFVPPLGDYAFLIHLDPAVVPRHFQAVTPDSKALASRASSVLAGDVAGHLGGNKGIRMAWDPVAEFVNAVEALYPSTLVLFYADGAPVIGGVWNPSAEGERPWSVHLGFPCLPVSGDAKAKVTLDKWTLLREVQRLGKGLVSRVEVTT